MSFLIELYQLYRAYRTFDSPLRSFRRDFLLARSK